jgi:lipid-A-disaccharide synthase
MEGEPHSQHQTLGGHDVDFVGHPLLDVISSRKKDFAAFIQENGLEDKPVIALLPGSRKQEISTILPIMLSVRKDFPGYQFVIAGAPGQTPEFYHQFIQGTGVRILFGKTYDLLEHASAGLVTSGTATLEAGLFSLPQVVCYKGSSISYLIAKRLIKIKYISLVNLILDKPAVKELIQNDLNATNVKGELKALLHDPQRRQEVLEDYGRLHEQLGGAGASQRTAIALLKSLK